MKRLLIASYDMEVGGVERSLAGMLEHFDYGRFAVDLMLYRHQGDFMSLIPEQVNLLDEQPACATFRQSIGEVFRSGLYAIGCARIASKLHTWLTRRLHRLTEAGYLQMQLMWRYALPFLPSLEHEYDAAISYLWPHDYVAYKVKARTKIAWIHTDYSTIETDKAADLRMWDRFDAIVAVSEACKASFLAAYPSLGGKVTVIENIASPAFIRRMADESEPEAAAMAADSRFKLLTVARLSHAKGIDQAVKAMWLLKYRGRDDIAWYVAGYGGDEPMLRDLIAQYNLQDCFILLGKRTNPYAFMNVCDLYVQPSRYEGKAVTVTEAQVLGKPVLITNYATAPSQVTDGVDGAIAELSVEGIADAVERLIRDEELRERLGACCRRTDYGNARELNKLYALLLEEERAERLTVAGA